MPPLTRDATSALLRALAAFAGCDLRYEDIVSRSWASVTFAGVRYEITLVLTGDGADEAADRFCAELENAEFDLRGHILASAAVIAREPDPDGVRIRIEALTVEDA